MIFFITMLSWVYAAPLVIDFQDDTSKETIQKLFGITVEWIHPNSEDEALAYVQGDLSKEQKSKLATS